MNIFNSIVAEGFFISLNHEGHSKETCAFCTKPPEPTDLENDLEAKDNMDAKELSGIRTKGIAFKNCADKLGKALCSVGEDQLFGEIKLKRMSNRLPVHTAAHHLIPGNASLKPSEIMAYLHVDKTANGNIGYSINNHENGSWLVGNYALRGEDGLPSWGELGTEFTKDTNKDPKEYAFAAIEKLKRQFHDAHADYNKFVLNELDLLAKKLQKKEDLWCPLDKKRKKWILKNFNYLC